ncbi:MAG: thioredoxin-disulfide reductase [Clostridia bacterium]|nr:thioredoxin-disulfide reductase [Clostridia bacterium]
MEKLDVAIIGGGPAGLAAGIYCARGGARVKLFEELFPGGQIVKTHRVENYPGLTGGPDGYALAAALEKHAAEFDLPIVYGPVSDLQLSEQTKTFSCNGEEFEAKALILAMGASPRKLGHPEEDRFVGAGISYCATCDGNFYRGKEVAIVGGGDTAVSDAMYLSAICSKVYLIHRRDSFRAAATLVEKVKSLHNVELVLSSTVADLSGEDKLTGITVEDVNTHARREIPVSGLFVAVGILPRNELVLGKVETDKGGFVLTDTRMQTSVPGVYAAGDLRNTPLRQVVTACADGAVAATMAVEYAGMHQ